jgi:arylformamidase
MTKIIDISWPITTTMTTYKNRGDVVLKHTKTWEADQARESAICLASHTGTHVDAPAHFIEYGKTIDACDLSQLCGPCIVLDLMHSKENISASDIEIALQPYRDDKILSTCFRILFKTRNSLLEPTVLFDQNFVYLTAPGAEYCAQIGAAAVGIDYLGIERNQPAHETHILLLSHNILIIEGLRLGHVQPGIYMLFCLPLLIVGGDAAPARAVLAF